MTTSPTSTPATSPAFLRSESLKRAAEPFLVDGKFHIHHEGLRHIHPFSKEFFLEALLEVFDTKEKLTALVATPKFKALKKAVELARNESLPSAGVIRALGGLSSLFPFPPSGAIASATSPASRYPIPGVRTEEEKQFLIRSNLFDFSFVSSPNGQYASGGGYADQIRWPGQTGSLSLTRPSALSFDEARGAVTRAILDGHFVAGFPLPEGCEKIRVHYRKATKIGEKDSSLWNVYTTPDDDLTCWTVKISYRAGEYILVNLWMSRWSIGTDFATHFGENGTSWTSMAASIICLGGRPTYGGLAVVPLETKEVKGEVKMPLKSTRHFVRSPRGGSSPRGRYGYAASSYASNTNWMLDPLYGNNATRLELLPPALAGLMGVAGDRVRSGNRYLKYKLLEFHFIMGRMSFLDWTAFYRGSQGQVGGVTEAARELCTALPDSVLNAWLAPPDMMAVSDILTRLNKAEVSLPSLLATRDVSSDLSVFGSALFPAQREESLKKLPEVELPPPTLSEKIIPLRYHRVPPNGLPLVAQLLDVARQKLVPAKAPEMAILREHVRNPNLPGAN